MMDENKQRNIDNLYVDEFPAQSEKKTKTLMHPIIHKDKDISGDRFITYEMPSEYVIKIVDRFEGHEDQEYAGKDLLKFITSNIRQFKHCNYDEDSLLGLTDKQKKRKEYNKAYNKKRRITNDF